MDDATCVCVYAGTYRKQETNHRPPHSYRPRRHPSSPLLSNQSPRQPPPPPHPSSALPCPATTQARYLEVPVLLVGEGLDRGRIHGPGHVQLRQRDGVLRHHSLACFVYRVGVCLHSKTRKGTVVRTGGRDKNKNIHGCCCCGSWTDNSEERTCGGVRGHEDVLPPLQPRHGLFNSTKKRWFGLSNR